MSPAFPDGLMTRAATVDDIDLVFGLLDETERHDIGESHVSRVDVEADMADPETDLAHDYLLVFDGAVLVGYVEVPGWRAEGEVHPDHRGRGIGSALVDWMEQRALERTPPGEEARVGQTKFDGCTSAVTLLRNRGYEVRHTSWVLRMPPGVDLADRAVPGVDIRSFTEADAVAVHRVIEDAFNEWPNRTPVAYRSWRTHTVDRPDFHPGLLRVALVDEEVVGACYALDTPDEGWVQSLAVRDDQRNRGIAQALLAQTFLELRGRGHTRLGLSTDSRTGALDLYVRLGMEVHETFRHWSKLLRPAEG
jgi:mycothiol synthase